MNDQEMRNILSNFNNADSGEMTTTSGEVRKNPASQEKDAMKRLLEGLDAQQRSVNQMPGDHKMAKATATKHPASKYLVGGEYDDEEELDADDIYRTSYDGFDDDEDGANPFSNWDENERRRDEIDDFMSSVDELDEGKKIPLTKEIIDQTIKQVWDEQYSGPRSGAVGIATLVHEVMGELEAAIDPETHVDMNYNVDKDAVEKRVDAFARYINTKSGGMSQDEKDEWDEYHGEYWEESLGEEKLGSKKPSKDVYKKQSLADIFKSMEEAEAEKSSNLAKEFHKKIKEKTQLKKGDNGKFELNDSLVEGMATANFESMTDDMKRLMSQGETIHLIAKESHVSDRYKGEIYDYKLTTEENESINEDRADAVFDLQSVIKNMAYFGQDKNSIEEEFKVNNGDTFIALAKKIVQAVKHVREQSNVEEDSNLKVRDPRAAQIIKKAKNEYSISADDDLSAVVNMMHDQDREQDLDIDKNADVNDEQEIDIDTILARLEKLEKDRD